MIDPLSPVSVLKGVGPKKAETLKRLNINTLEDLLYFFPVKYQDRRNIKPVFSLIEGDTALIKVQVTDIKGGHYYGGKQSPLKVTAKDDTGVIELIFFNPKYYLKSFSVGKYYTFFGKVFDSYGSKKMAHPDFTPLDNLTGEDFKGILPLYSLTRGITQNELQRLQRQVCRLDLETEDYLPEYIVKDNRLCSLKYALNNIHFPEDEQRLKEARFRFAFEELFLFLTSLMLHGEKLRKENKSHRYMAADSIKELSLPFKLTGAQERVWNEIQGQMRDKLPMNRLVQGDVGSGKTVIAALALSLAAQSGYQAVMMAPTELLAKQHYGSISDLLSPLGIKTGLLTSSSTAKERQEILSGLSDGTLKVLIGTHAVIEPNVIFKDLTLVIADEQHRFGVEQRIKLSEKGKAPDIIVMTATPIPRTLASLLYGDLDVSIIDELPPGRPEIITTTVGSDNKRDEMYSNIKKLLEENRQCYVVTPLIDESDFFDVRSASEVYKELTEKLKPYKVALLHGNMKAGEKEAVMEDFKGGKYSCLVSTVVIEVGIHVENATVIVIENAERFGLSQLHQLRGRIGRGTEISYCYLVSEAQGEVSKQRLAIMTESRDGFYIAEKDLDLRGPGEVFGTRQHGINEFVIADLRRHYHILLRAKEESIKLIKKDPDLSSYPLLYDRVKTIMAKASM